MAKFIDDDGTELTPEQWYKKVKALRQVVTETTHGDARVAKDQEQARVAKELEEALRDQAKVIIARNRTLDVGESPAGETDEYCSATLAPGTMSLCQNRAVAKRLLHGGNRGAGLNIPLCEYHLNLWETQPGSFEIAIPPTEVLKARPQ